MLPYSIHIGTSLIGSISSVGIICIAPVLVGGGAGIGKVFFC